jgi:Cytochrome P460
MGFRSSGTPAQWRDMKPSQTEPKLLTQAQPARESVRCPNFRHACGLACAFLFVTLANSDLAPAPKVDRVGFPKDYRTNFKVLGVPARTNTPPSIVLTAYGNDLAASVTNAAQSPYPNGSIIVMEFAEVLKDSEGRPLRDANGQPQKGRVEHVDVMRRGDGFGEAYGANRSGQWEFAGYHLDGTYSTPPAKSASCAQCHQKAGAAKDFVFPLKASASAAGR